MNIHSFRKDYQCPELKRESLDADPLKQFESWFKEACDQTLPEPNAMSLATVSETGQPSLRTVLLKFFDQKGFVFFTNYTSRKSREIEQNPQVCLLFPWVALARQVTISGQAQKISPLESAKYFASRPRDSQLGAWISNQSSVIGSRSVLKAQLEKAKQKFRTGEIPLPDFWGGYRVVPETIEFWQGQTSRLHDRFLYTRENAQEWKIDRLAP